MTTAELVPTRETCERMRDAGFPQETLFAWWLSHYETMNDAAQPGGEWFVVHVASGPGRCGELVCAAPTLAEIMAELPPLASVFRMIVGDAWRATTATIPVRDAFSDNPAEAAALLWLAINENGDRA